MEQSGGNSLPEPVRISKAATAVESSGDNLRFRVELVPGETTVVSWKKLLKEANSSNSIQRGWGISFGPSGGSPASAYFNEAEARGERIVEVLYKELAASWPSGFMDTYGIRYAILRAKERRSLPSNLMKDPANIKKKTLEDSSRAVAINATQALLHTREKHGEKMVHAAAPMNIACTNKQKQERAKGSSCSSAIYTRPTDISSKNKVKGQGKPSTDVDEAQFRQAETPQVFGCFCP